MDFFQHQQEASRRTFVLVVLYLLAVVFSVFLVYFVFLWIAAVFRHIYNVTRVHWDFSGAFTPLPHPGWWDLKLFSLVGITSLLVMLGCALSRLRKLASGGYVLPELLGGKMVRPDTKDHARRRLLNIVEEIAIAAGMQVPFVYVLEREIGINAFASGFSRDDASITVTKSCLNVLSRDELQAVVAHEICHILYGDTYVKTCLAGLLYGIMLPGRLVARTFSDAISGELLTRVFLIAGLAFCFFTIPFVIVTQIGVLLAGAIKRMVSVQREFRADAAAVQFTRNGSAVAGALKKIGGYTAGSRILSLENDCASHLFFANSLGTGILNMAWLSSHPSLTERIRRIEPDFSGKYEFVSSNERMHEKYMVENRGENIELETIESPSLETSLATIGNPTGRNIAAASAVIASIPAIVQDAVRNTDGVQSVVYAMLVSEDSEIRSRQLEFIEKNTDQKIITEVYKFIPIINKTKAVSAVVKMAVRSMKGMSHTEYLRFLDNVEALIAADGKVSLLESAVRQTIVSQLSPVFKKHRALLTEKIRQDVFISTCRELLSCLAYWGTYDVAEEEDAYRAGIAVITGTGEPAPDMLPVGECSEKLFKASLDKLSNAVPHQQKKIMEACAACIASNNKTTPDETQLFSAIAEALNCPLPAVF